MAMTVRLPDGLREEARGYGDQVGLTLNALIGVALREYLDRRQPGRVESVSPVRSVPALERAPAVDPETEFARAARAARVKTKPKRGRK